MKILKFGGTSIGSPENIKKVSELITTGKTQLVVFSAFNDITNLLSDFIQQLDTSSWTIAEKILDVIKEKHLKMIDELLTSKNFKKIVKNKIQKSIQHTSKFLYKEINDENAKIILAQGELLSTTIIYLYLLEKNIDVALLPALEFMKLTKTGEPDYRFINSRLTNMINKHNNCNFYITQGFICLNHKNNIDNLGRGGSDYTATIIGQSLHADSVEIWTDIDGLQNNDPRFVDCTKTIDFLSYEEASELAYFGAKILHPLTIKPIQQNKIPLIIKNTYNPNAKGTTIYNYKKTENLKAVASKDRITTVRIKAGEMMQAYGFLKKIFEIFENYKTSVDMLTTSEISVAMTIENDTYISQIEQNLQMLGEIEIERNQSIICIVQDYSQNMNMAVQNIIESMADIPIKMISYGSSKYNFSLIVDTKNKPRALNLLNQYLLRNDLCLAQQE